MLVRIFGLGRVLCERVCCEYFFLSFLWYYFRVRCFVVGVMGVGCVDFGVGSGVKF